MKDLNEMLYAVKWITCGLLYDGGEDRERLISLLNYYRVINNILIDLLKLAGDIIKDKKVDNHLVMTLFDGYYTYIKAFNTLLCMSSKLPDLDKDLKKELLTIISRMEDVSEFDEATDRLKGLGYN